MLFIFDIDGTISNPEHRLSFLNPEYGKMTSEDWDKFYAAADQDKPIWEIITVARALANAGNTIVYSTGRKAGVRQLTLNWLNKYRLPQGNLFMRADNDHRQDNIVKSELLDQVIHNFPGSEIGGAFEDRQQVVKMYRERGIRVFQVAEGAY
jgi:uncharacterized HAD superfamily protein